jgi:hypothetical protein
VYFERYFVIKKTPSFYVVAFRIEMSESWAQILLPEKSIIKRWNVRNRNWKRVYDFILMLTETSSVFRLGWPRANCSMVEGIYAGCYSSSKTYVILVGLSLLPGQSWAHFSPFVRFSAYVSLSDFEVLQGMILMVWEGSIDRSNNFCAFKWP